MPDAGAVAVRARSLGKRYRVWIHPKPTNVSERVWLALQRLGGGFAGDDRPHRDVWAFRDVSFEVRAGEVLGVLGANGAGKSSLLAVLARITEPTEGEAELYGRVSSLLEVGTGFHPELSGRDNVYLNAAALGMSKRETARKYDEIVDFSGVRDFIELPVKRYSTGMYMRLAFAVAAHVDPEILLLDEVLSVGDQAFQEKSLKRIEEMTRAGRTVLFVSHDANSVARLCERGIVLGGGGVEFAGDVDAALEHYLGNRRTVHGGGHLRDVEREGTGEARFCDVGIAGADGSAIVA
ncbi:MAG: ABC transporter ATP-binding protein, partial [Actinobacteria bacterium]|nr:ABC transporter ATP-binding protein [Actinomycetota bacterium]